jgi:predicted dehydrogenase
MPASRNRPINDTVMVRLGIAGFGRLVQEYYVPAIYTLPGIQVVAIADPLAASRSVAARRFPGAQIVSDSEALFEKVQVDALAVASPPSTHLYWWNEAVRRQIPVLMEKPFVVGGEIAIASNSPTVRPLLMPNFNRRWWPAYRAIRKLCAEGFVGAIKAARFTLRVNVEPWNTVTRHRLSPGEGGPLYDLGSSEFDLIEYMFGATIESINAHMEDAAGHEVFLEVTLNNGVRVECDLAYAARNRESISIVGSRASLRMDNPNFALHVVARGKREFLPIRWVRDCATLGSRAIQRNRSMLRYTIRASLAEFIDALTNGRPFSPGFEDAAHNSACLEATLKSVRNRTRVNVEANGSVADVLRRQA